MPNDAKPHQPIQIDIISDVMCPWCIVGYRQLEQALAGIDTGALIRWHPFELNPDMPTEGQNLRDHIAENMAHHPNKALKIVRIYKASVTDWESLSILGTTAGS